jgi:glutathionylspermidine synthase
MWATIMKSLSVQSEIIDCKHHNILWSNNYLISLVKAPIIYLNFSYNKLYQNKALVNLLWQSYEYNIPVDRIREVDKNSLFSSPRFVLK